MGVKNYLKEVIRTFGTYPFPNDGDRFRFVYLRHTRIKLVETKELIWSIFGFIFASLFLSCLTQVLYFLIFAAVAALALPLVLQHDLGPSLKEQRTTDYELKYKIDPENMEGYVVIDDKWEPMTPRESEEVLSVTIYKDGRYIYCPKNRRIRIQCGDICV